ncbi:hypothetical protein [Mycobacterium sp.]|uniref:hypothetical protein n=1 Tax=Mycobacterium sp. TaxID=1785 RepID=UPI002D8DE36C|nr:hypothetical protein [Mycobacterium sp.]
MVPPIDGWLSAIEQSPGDGELAAGAAPRISLRCTLIGSDAIRSDGTTLVGSGIPRPGIDGRLRGGDDTRLLTPVANGPVTGSNTGATLTAEAAAVPGTCRARGGMRLATDVTLIACAEHAAGTAGTGTAGGVAA